MPHDAPSSAARQPHPADALAEHLDELELLPVTDPEAAREPAAEAQEAARGLGRIDLELRARLVTAEVAGRLGDVAAVGRTAHEVNRWAVVHGDRHLLARSHRVLSVFYHLIGDSPLHLEHAVRAVEYLDDGSSQRMRAHHLVGLATALRKSGSYQESRSRLQRAEDLAVALGDVKLQIRVLNNRSFGEYDAGDAHAAMQAADRMLALAGQHGMALSMTELDTVARAQMALGRYTQAEQTLLGALGAEEAHRSPEANALAETLLTLAETQRLLGATDRARETLDRCAAQCDALGLAGIRVRVQRERAELCAIEGAYRDAYEQYRAFHAQAEALRSQEGDVRARTLQAVFETDEARRDSLRFREMSLHDPLTGLYNRRYVDERLGTLLREAATDGTPLSVGLADLDYFKRVNDTLSHEVGDRVLIQVAALLAGAVSEPAFAARLGGEEFLLVLPGCSAQEAFSVCEAARTCLRSHSWPALTGGLAITTSIGVTSVTAGRTTPSALLADADRNLYAAKRAGRDRVVADPA